MNIVAENLMLIIDPDSDASSAAARLWLEHRLENTPEQKPASEGSRTNPTGLTESEVISIQAHNSMTSIILYVSNEQRSEPSGVKALNEDLCEALETQLAHITRIKNGALAVEGTLHSLYMAYELGTMVVKFASYLSRTKPDIYNTQDETNLKTREVAGRLLQAVIEKSKTIKKELDESGWIDKVLEGVSHGEQTSPDEPKAIADTLKGVLGESFLEEWAGHILESWRDSVAGFSYFKAPAKA
jgi:N-terminal acetyltransferase B complex non-catalytic subunit